MGFDRVIAGREVADYADFLVPHLNPAARVLESGLR